MVWGFALLALILFAEVGRFLHMEVQRRRELDVSSFPSDPKLAARLSPAALESADRAEFARGAGLIVRMDLALAALVAAIGAGLHGTGLLFWVALALGPAQLVFLVPAVVIGLSTRQTGSVRALLRGSAPAFAVSAVCGLWLLLAPQPAPPAPPPAPVVPLPAIPPLSPVNPLPAFPPRAVLPRGSPETHVASRYFSASLPEGWLTVWQNDGPPPSGARYEPPVGPDEAGVAYIEINATPGGDAQALDNNLSSMIASSYYLASPIEPRSLGGLDARMRRVLRHDPQRQTEMLERWVASNGPVGYVIDCYGRENRVHQAEAACDLFARTFRPLGGPDPAPADPGAVR